MSSLRSKLAVFPHEDELSHTAPLSHQVTQVSKPRPTPAGVTQALPLVTPTSSLVSPPRCLSTTSMSPVPDSMTPPRSAGGLEYMAGCLEGRACPRRKKNPPVSFSHPLLRKCGDPGIALHGTVLPRPSILCLSSDFLHSCLTSELPVPPKTALDLEGGGFSKGHWDSHPHKCT